MRKLTARTARKMQAARITRGGGPKLKPRDCRKCGTACPSTVAALAHCAGKR